MGNFNNSTRDRLSSLATAHTTSYWAASYGAHDIQLVGHDYAICAGLIEIRTVPGGSKTELVGLGLVVLSPPFNQAA